MRTATTIGRSKDGWKLISGPDVPADKQRAKYNDVAMSWPDGVLEVRFQLNDGPAKSRTREKSESVIANTKAFERRAEEKAELAKQFAADQKKAADAEAAKKKQAEAEQRAREIKAKADAKAR